MANIPKPNGKTSKPKNEKKPASVTTVTPPAEEKVPPLQLDVGKTVKNEYKAYAAGQGQSMKELFIEMFEFYKDNH